MRCQPALAEHLQVSRDRGVAVWNRPGGHLPGHPGQEILADWRVSNAAIASGVVRFVDPSRTRFNTGRAQVNLLQPGTNYADRFHQVDIRLSKSFEIGAEARAWVTLDIANLLNDNTIIDQNNTYGPVWLGPDELLFGRIFKPGRPNRLVGDAAPDHHAASVSVRRGYRDRSDRPVWRPRRSTRRTTLHLCCAT